MGLANPNASDQQLELQPRELLNAQLQRLVQVRQ